VHIDASRIGPAGAPVRPSRGLRVRSGADAPTSERSGPTRGDGGGRWPTNLLLGHAPGCSPERCTADCPIGALGARARFFYCAKADRRERDAGCEHLRPRTIQTFAIGRHAELKATAHPVANHHPTVKPLALMRWLVRLVTPPGGLVVDPFCGSGSTGCAAVLEGLRFFGIERDPAYAAIACARIQHWSGLGAEPPPAATPTGQASA
jgi:site-specific DNA-methyltransferase (adenine-specific)